MGITMKTILLIALIVILFVGCDTTNRPVADDDPPHKNVEIVDIWPDTNQVWPPPYKVEDMEAYEAFLKDLDYGKILPPNIDKLSHETHTIDVSFDGMPQNLRITERPDNMALHRLHETKKGALLTILMLCGPAHYDGNNGHRITLEWETGSRHLGL